MIYIKKIQFFFQEKNVCVVKQASLDFEHVSYKVAEIICNLEGHKFWCYNDYDSAIIDVNTSLLCLVNHSDCIDNICLFCLDLSYEW